MLYTKNFHASCKSSQTTGYQHCHHDHLFHRHSRICCNLFIGSDYRHFKSCGSTFPVNDVKDDGCNGDQDSDRKLCLWNQKRKLCTFQNVFTLWISSLFFLDRTIYHVLYNIDRNVVHHNGCDHLTGFKSVLQPSYDSAPERSADKSGDQTDQNVKCHRKFQINTGYGTEQSSISPFPAK